MTESMSPGKNSDFVRSYKYFLLFYELSAIQNGKRINVCVNHRTINLAIISSVLTLTYTQGVIPSVFQVVEKNYYYEYTIQE